MRTVLGLAFRSLAIVCACVSALACTTTTTTTTAPPTDCWIGLRGEYHLAGPPDAAIAGADAAAQVVHARLSRFGLAMFTVLAPREGNVEVNLPFMADPTEVRELIMPAGDVSFVPIPDGLSIENGDQIPANLVALFGRDGIGSAQTSTSAAGQSSLDIQLVPGAAQVFADHSQRNVGRQFAIAIDGVILAAPMIQAPVVDGRMTVSGGLSQQEASRLSAILSVPALSAPLTEVSFGPFTPPANCLTPQ